MKRAMRMKFQISKKQIKSKGKKYNGFIIVGYDMPNNGYYVTGSVNEYVSAALNMKTSEFVKIMKEDFNGLLLHVKYINCTSIEDIMFFTKREDADKALEWLNSLMTMNTLIGQI